MSEVPLYTDGVARLRVQGLGCIYFMVQDFGFIREAPRVLTRMLSRAESSQERLARSTVNSTYAEGQHVLRGVRGAVLALVVRQYNTSLSVTCLGFGLRVQGADSSGAAPPFDALGLGLGFGD